MSSGIADFVDDSSGSDSDRLDMKVMSVEYTEDDGGTIVHVFGRDADGERHHVEVVGHRPSFYISEAEYDDRVDKHHAVVETERADEEGERYRNLHGDPLVRVYTQFPGQVADLRETFDETWEADVFYDKRWLIDSGVYTWVRVDTSDADDHGYVRGDCRVTDDCVEPLDPDEQPDVSPRLLVLDIEVAGEGEVPDADAAESPVSTTVAWDSGSGEYVGWLLYDDSCSWQPSDISDTELDDCRVFGDESEMLQDIHEWVAAADADIISGWFSNDFDLPYLINRSKNLNVYGYQDWSPLGETYTADYGPVVAGREPVDMLAGYEKTCIHNLKSRGLEDIAQRELGEGKVDHELGYTEMWRQKPEEFLRYNRIDVELVHRIDESRGVIELLDNLRAVTGCSYSAPIGGNIDMMDMLVLRKAQEYGYALPTAEKPDVGGYHGAYVFTPSPGLHQHVLYPDYSSLYPNMMYQCNISPETLVGTEEDLAESDYDEDDCVWTYLDTQTPPSQKSDVDVSDDQMERCYFLDPSVEEGFIRSVLDDIMGMCDQYEGGMYAAAKRVRNSAYGVLGDSDSYGKGFRLFDWRLAEGTTLGGQKVLKAGAEKFVDAVNERRDGGEPPAEVIGGDTDSVMTTIPFATDGEHALSVAQDAADEVNDWLDGYTAETFGLSSPDEARMELEVESYADSLFFKASGGEATKKRYAQLVRWDDDDGWLDDPETTIVGFEYVRSDYSDLTARVQKEVLDALMQKSADEAREHVESVVSETIADTMQGVDGDGLYGGLDDLGIPFGIGQPLEQYGSPDRTPQPSYRGAKFANRFIYGGEAITEGSRPMKFYIEEGATGDGVRSTYQAVTAEDGRYVDAISVLDADDLPDGCVVDREKMVQKTIIDPLEDICTTMGWGTEWMHDAVEDAKQPSDYRDDDQMGFENFVEPDGDSGYRMEEFM